jgi:hypothetical protein
MVPVAERHHQLRSAHRFDDQRAIPCNETDERKEDTGKKRKKNSQKDTVNHPKQFLKRKSTQTNIFK